MSISFRKLVLFRWCGPLLAALVLASPAFAGLGSLALRAAPDVVRSDGHSTTTITAEVRDSSGRIVPDGTQVHFTTTAGRIDEVAPTVAGRARATFTSDAIEGVAQVSAFSGGSSATLSIRMAENPEALTPASRVMTLSGKYVAYSESRGVLEGIGDIRLTWKGQLITAQAVQADLLSNVIRAQDGVTVQARHKKASVTGDRIAIDMLSDQATLVTGDKRQVIDLPTLSALTGSITALAPNPVVWDDLTDSQMLWVAKRAVVIPGQKVQLSQTSAYLGGQRIVHLPYHEVSLTEGLSSQGQQYLGVGTNGLTIDLPYYLGMSPEASTSLRLRRGQPTGFGWYGTNPGWELDLQRQYGLPGGTQGTFAFDRITSSDWGLHWDHSQHLAKGTQAYALLEYPAHRDLFTNLNLSHQGHWGGLTLNLSGNKLEGHGFSRTLDLSAESAPRPLGGGLRLSLESRLYDARNGDFVAFDGKQYAVAPSYSREVGLRLTPAVLKLGRGGLSSWLSVKQVWGSADRSGFGVEGSAVFNQPIGRTGGMTLNYSYNQFPGVTFYGPAGRQNLSASLRISPVKRLSLSTFGSLGLDSPTRTLTVNAAYSFGPLWRLELEQTAYHFQTLQEADLQFGISRSLGARSLTLYWSRLQHRVLFEVTGGTFAF